LIIEIHGEWDKAPIAYKRLNKKFKWISDRIGMWTIRNCDGLRVISRAVYESVRDIKKEIFRFPAFTDIETFLKVREREIIPHRFVYVGQLIRLKGIETIINSIEILKSRGIEIEVLLIGKGADMDRFEKIVKKARLEAQIKFLGFRNQSDVAELIKTSIALLLPSYTEGFGRVIIEAFACSRAVIGSHVGGIPELVESGKTGLLVEPGNAEDLAEKLIFAIENTDKMREMGKRGRESVEKRFGSKEFCENQYKMVKSVLHI
jgi:glycosyltransferase involved in cell wall biosynthesis